MVDISYWPETLRRWRGEGLPPDADVRDLLGLDHIEIIRFDTGVFRREETIEETDEFIGRLDSHGREVKAWKNTTATPAFVRHPLRKPEDWERYRQELDLDWRRRNPGCEMIYKKASERGDFMTLSVIEPAWYLIDHLFGFEEGLACLITEPEAAGRILNDYTDHLLRFLDTVISGPAPRPDARWFFSDLCYKNGMLFSPAVCNALILPVHRRFRKFCDERGMALMLHCDGDVRELIPLIIRAGFDVIQPLEARCGNDVRALKPRHGRDITLFGNISADIVAEGDREKIEDEVRGKVTAAKQGGGYIYHIDHSVPPTVSFESYCYMIDLVRKYGKL
jgi:uroporphyrinogen decarboxylase